MGAGLTHLIMPYIFTGMAALHPDFVAWRCAYFIPGAAQVGCSACFACVDLCTLATSPGAAPTSPRRWLTSQVPALLAMWHAAAVLRLNPAARLLLPARLHLELLC